ncbi:MAG: hypothetical protein ACOYB3_00250 [Azonexus sp.]
MRTELLKELLAIPTYTGQEQDVVDFLVAHANEHGYGWEVNNGNVLVTKGTPKPGEFYPLVCAHTDSVHQRKPMEIVQNDEGEVYAVNPETREQIGCGGDDKAGVFICLELLSSLPVLKAAFFWGEEVYCKGSQAVGPEFFEDVGYCIEFDSPQSDIVSYSCDGVQLFEEHGAFAKVAVPILDDHGMDKWQQHPYTDVAVLKRRFDFTCINLPAGYYYMHSRHEIVNLTDVANAIIVGNKLVEALGYQKYPFKSARWEIMETDRKTTGLVLDWYGSK